jgi:hypothetical protein
MGDEQSAPDHVLDPDLVSWAKRWATPRQVEYIDAVIANGGVRPAARALGLSRSAIQTGLRAVEAARDQWTRQQAIKPKGTEGFVVRELTTSYDGEGKLTSECVREGPDPKSYGGVGEGPERDGHGLYRIKGVSTYYGAARDQRGQWVKTDLNHERWVEHVKAAVSEFYQGPVETPIAAPSAGARQDTDVIPWIEIGDGHLGMLAFSAETGANFDIKIGERELCAAISLLIDEMVHHERGVINDLGDFTHYENIDGVTEASGHRLDYDSRYGLMIRVYSRVMRFIVSKVLEKATYVDVIVNQGNHSRKNDLWMAELLRVAYGHTGRVNVLNNDSVFIGYRMGATLVMTHHSDKCRPAKLAHVMTNDFREDWGETEYHYIDIGHIHHNMVLKEHPGVSIESFNTLAPKDKWATDGGWRSQQSITVIHRSRTYGEIGRRVLPIRQVHDTIRAAMETEGKPAETCMATIRRAYAV